MMAWVLEFLNEIWMLLVSSAPFLLLGFILAGFIKVWIPEAWIVGQLGADKMKSVILGAIYGTPLPLCSCSVIPTAVSLRKAGASKGATASFLVSTPETGVDSISVTYALMDPLMAVLRPVAALVTAIFTGAGVNFLVKRGWDEQVGEAAGDELAEESGSCCSDPEPVDKASKALEEAEQRLHEGHDHGPDGHDHGAGGEEQRSWRKALHYAFVTLLDDLTPWFLIGFALSGLIAVLTPDNFFTEVVPRGWPAVLLMMLVGTPMYICATASTPIAVAMVAKGLEPGAALVFLLVGPATNVTTLLVVSNLLGKRSLMVYVGMIVSVALLFGIFVNELYSVLGLDLASAVEQTLSHHSALWQVLLAVFLTVMILLSALRLGLVKSWFGKLENAGVQLGAPRWIARGALMALPVALWLSTACSSVLPGEVAFQTRFGRVVETISEPGLHLHWPAPFETLVRERTDRVRKVRMGHGFEAPAAGENPSEKAASERRRLEAEAEMLSGDGNLLAITYSVHYTFKDAYRARFNLANPDRLVRACSESACRRLIASLDSGSLLVGERLSLEQRIQTLLQADLDDLESGLQVVRMLLRDVHAPEDVHRAYRDVASALEDRERSIHEAQGFQAQELAKTRAVAWALEQEAATESWTRRQVAEGEASAFRMVSEALRKQPELHRLRLYLEAVESMMADTQRVFVLGGEVQYGMIKVLNSGDLLGDGFFDGSSLPDGKRGSRNE